jgi:hypothetical protein
VNLLKMFENPSSSIPVILPIYQPANERLRA